MPNATLTAAIDKVAAGTDLSADEAAAVLEAIMRDEASEIEIAGFLMALRAKGETVEEVTGLARTMRALATPVDAGRDDPLDHGRRARGSSRGAVAVDPGLRRGRVGLDRGHSRPERLLDRNRHNTVGAEAMALLESDHILLGDRAEVAGDAGRIARESEVALEHADVVAAHPLAQQPRQGPIGPLARQQLVGHRLQDVTRGDVRPKRILGAVPMGVPNTHATRVPPGSPFHDPRSPGTISGP